MISRISVVTINYLNPKGLRATLHSVLEQDYPNLEFIVKDGGSCGEDAEILAAFSHRIDHLNQEPDAGIYDAMNKAVKMSSGDWVIFMNAGDVFHSSDALSRLMGSVDADQADIICAQAQMIYDDDRPATTVYAQPADTLPYRMNCSHQAVLARRDILAQHPFIVAKDRISSDYGFLLNCYAHAARFVLSHETVADCEAGGLSQIERLKSLRDRILCLKETSLMTPRLLLYYNYLLGRAHLRSWLSFGALK